MFKKLVFLLILLFIPISVFSATIFEDDFNSYGNGTLSGTSTWTGSVKYQVQGTAVYEGTKAVRITNGTNDYIIASGAAQTAGKIGYYVWATADCGASTYCPFFYIRENTINKGGVVLYGGTMKIRAYNGNWYDLADWAINTKYRLDIEWESVPTQHFRVIINNGTPSAWYTPATPWAVAPNQIMIWSAADSDNSIYFDYISENSYTPPSEGNATGTSEEIESINLLLVLGIALFLVGAAQYQHFFKSL